MIDVSSKLWQRGMRIEVGDEMMGTLGQNGKTTTGKIGYPTTGCLIMSAKGGKFQTVSFIYRQNNYQ